MRVRVSAEIFEQIEKIRESGRSNMYAAKEIQVIADEMGFSALVCWIEDHKGLYIEGIIRGFEDESKN